MKLTFAFALVPALLLAFATSGIAAAPAADIARFNKEVRPLLQSHCVTCHGPEKPKSEFRVDTLNPDLFVGDDGDRWQEVFDQLNSSDMPPKDAKQPLTRAQRETITGWLQSEMKLASEFRSAAGGRPTMRRLTKYEFTYTLRDLLKLDRDHTQNLPEDRAGADGLRNNVSLLGMTPIQFELIQEAVGTAVGKALVGPEKPRVFQYHAEPEKGDYDVPKKRDRELPGKVMESGLLMPARSQYVMRFPERPREGKFQIRVRTGSSHDDDDDQPRLQVWLGYQVTGVAFAKTMVAELPVTASLERPDVMTFEGVMEGFPMPVESEGKGKINQGMMIWLVVADDEERERPAKTDRKQKKKRGKGEASAASKGNDSAKPQVLLDWVEFEGPCYDSWPPASRTACIGASRKPQPLEVLQSFASRAWRRPVSSIEVKPYVEVFSRQLLATRNFDEAMKSTLSLILTSSDFLYITEVAGGPSSNLTEHELATRLSYFLWSSLPDDALRQATDKGQLNSKDAIAEQVRRMLADPKAQRLATHFTEQWLGVDQIGSVAVNPEYYPDFEDETKASLEREPSEFFWYVLSQKRSALEFLDSNYVVVDETLARHYGLKDVTGANFRQVKVEPEDHRGGVLGMGGFMLAQSDGAHSHPIFRGKWLLANLLNTPPPPPPPDVPQLDQADPKFAKLSLKEQLAFHRQKEACASCHDRLDPYGLSLENFDAVGQWRESELRILSPPREVKPKAKKKKREAAKPTTETVPVDAAVKLPDGTSLKGFAELKAYLVSKKRDVFAEGLVRKLLAYALGRSLTWTDQAEVTRLKESFAASGYRLDALITEIVLSTPFRNK